MEKCGDSGEGVELEVEECMGVSDDGRILNQSINV